MFGVLLALVCGLAVYFVARTDRTTESPIVGTVVGAYVLRLVLQTFVRYIPFFSHGIGGDYSFYEAAAKLLTVVWKHTGYHYVTGDEIPELGSTNLPANIYGTIMYINDGPTRLGCTAVVALCACLTCFNLYRLAMELGAREGEAYRVLLLTLFAPAFVMYTSDEFKDGFVIALATSAVASSFRLARKFSLLHAFIAVTCLVGLWQVRFYLVFVTTAPLVVGFFGLGSKSMWRPVLAAIAMLAIGAFVVAYTDVVEKVTDTATTTFMYGNAQDVRDANAMTGSGVSFDDGGNAFGAFGPKLLYTLFSPFPWHTGSIGLQIGKLDTFIWYFLCYRAFHTVRRLIREQLGVLLMFAVFVVPTTVMYATSMANMGLIVRQRLPVVLVAAVLAALYVPKKVPETVRAAPRRQPSPRPERAAAN